MSNCNCGFDIGDPRMDRHSATCSAGRIAELEAKVEALREANAIWCTDYAKLKAENQRLRAAVAGMNPNNPFSVIEVQAMVEDK